MNRHLFWSLVLTGLLALALGPPIGQAQTTTPMSGTVVQGYSSGGVGVMPNAGGLGFPVGAGTGMVNQMPVTQSVITQTPFTQMPLTQSVLTQTPFTDSPVTGYSNSGIGVIPNAGVLAFPAGAGLGVGTQAPLGGSVPLGYSSSGVGVIPNAGGVFAFPQGAGGMASMSMTGMMPAATAVGAQPTAGTPVTGTIGTGVTQQPAPAPTQPGSP